MSAAMGMRETRGHGDAVVFDKVTKVFRADAGLLGWLGRGAGGVTRALNNVSVCVERGEVLVLLGPNGAGKTTLLKLASTMLLPDRGRVSVLGADTRQRADLVRQNVGFAVATERSFFPRLTARENLEFFAVLDNVPRRARRERCDQALERVGLLDAGRKMAMQFSSGMQQRLGIARALLKSPAVLLLDEPTRSLDPGAAGELWQFLQKLAGAGTAVLLASHNFEEATAIADSVAVLRQGGVLCQHSLRSHSSLGELRDFYFAAVQGTPEPAGEQR